MVRPIGKSGTAFAGRKFAHSRQSTRSTTLNSRTRPFDNDPSDSALQHQVHSQHTPTISDKGEALAIAD